MLSDMIATCESMKIDFDEPANEGFFSKFYPQYVVYDSPNSAFAALTEIVRKNKYEFGVDASAKALLKSDLIQYNLYPGMGKYKSTSVLKSINGVPVIITTRDNAIEGKPSTVIFSYVLHKSGDTKMHDTTWNVKCRSTK